VVAQPAMDIDFFFRPLLKKRKELNEFLVLRRRPAAGANVDEAHAVFFRALSFRFDGALPLAAKVHNGGNADFLQLLDASFVRLRTTVEKIVDLAHVGDAAQLDFFGKRRTGRLSRIAGASGARAPGGEKRGEKQSKNLRSRQFHKERAFSHLDGDCKWNLRDEKCGKNFKREPSEICSQKIDH